MDEQIIIDRIINEAKAEAKKIVHDAKHIAKGNINYAKEQSEKDIEKAVTAAQTSTARDIEIANSINELWKRLDVLAKKTSIVDKIFDELKKEIKFKWRVIDTPDYEIRMTPDELLSELREEIEPAVVEGLFK